MSVLDKISESRIDVRESISNDELKIIRLDKNCNDLFKEEKWKLWLAYIPPDEDEKITRSVKLFKERIETVGRCMPGVGKFGPVYIVRNEHGLFWKVAIGFDPDVRSVYSVFKLIISLLSMLNGMYGNGGGVVYWQFVVDDYVYKVIDSLKYKSVFMTYNSFSKEERKMCSML